MALAKFKQLVVLLLGLRRVINRGVIFGINPDAVVVNIKATIPLRTERMRFDKRKGFCSGVKGFFDGCFLRPADATTAKPTGDMPLSGPVGTIIMDMP